LKAFARAREEARRAEPDDAIRGALMALRSPLPLSSPSPELWTLLPSTQITVDMAGYTHERPAELPDEIPKLAASEPDGTLHAAVLHSLEVRRPDLRAAREWMDSRGALLATLVASEGEADGVLVLPHAVPHGGRSLGVTLEEVRQLKRTADALAASCHARAATMRMQARAQEAAESAQAAKDREAKLRRDELLEARRWALSTERLARAARVGVYAGSSRMAAEALEGRAAAGAPIAVCAPTGLDPVPYLARAHLAGPRAAAPIIIVDATNTEEHDRDRWSDPSSSPLAMADGGMLVILDSSSLPSEIQGLVSRACAEGRAPWPSTARLDVQLAATATIPSNPEQGTLRFGHDLHAALPGAWDHPIVLPSMRDRPEDLRALLTDRLAREGQRMLGRPVGIEPAAYGRLAQYDFPGDERELGSIVQRLVARCHGDSVRAADVEALNLVPAPHATT
jgi:hypothetical protein